MSNNGNNNLGIEGLSKNLINKGNALNKTQPSSTTNVNSHVSSSRSLEPKLKDNNKIVIQVRVGKSEVEILKEHFDSIGYDTLSSGVRGLIKKYMKENHLV